MWPESRESLPKQFIPLIGERSTFQSIVSLVGDPAVFDPAVVITNFDYRFRVAEQLREIGAEAVILLEPDRRDSAAAVGAAAAWAAARDPKTVRRRARRRPCLRGRKASSPALCAEACAAAEAGEIVTFGVTPDHPATGYGYIHPGAPLAIDSKVRRIERFVEKPDETRARAFIEEGYLWNSGNFVFRADVMLEELQRFEPEIAAATAAAVSRAKKDLGFVVLDHDSFAKAPKTSIDYAVMERTARAVVLTADVGWSDVGEWSAVWRLKPARRQRQQPARTGGRHRFFERAGAFGGAIGRRHRPQQRGRRRHWRRGPGRRPVTDRQGQEARRAPEGRGQARSDRASAHLPAVGLLSEHRPGLALPGQAHRRAPGRPAVPAEAPPSRGALGGRARRGRGDAQRQGRRSYTRTSRSTCRSARPIVSPTPARSTSS